MAKNNQLDDIRASIDALKSNTGKNKSRNKAQGKKPESKEIPAKGVSKPGGAKSQKKKNITRKKKPVNILQRRRTPVKMIIRLRLYFSAVSMKSAKI